MRNPPHSALLAVRNAGDAYMIVSGHDGVGDHAQRLMRMAQDMLSVVEKMQGMNGEAIEIRIGLHTGGCMGWSGRADG